MRIILLAALALTACETLFPELGGQMQNGADLSSGDGPADAGAGQPRIAGQVCSLSDLRDFRTCKNELSVFRVTVEETRDSVMSDAQGRFALLLTTKLGTATLAAIDPSGRFLPSVTPVRLVDGVLDPVAIPVVLIATRDQAAQQMGVSPDPTRGVLFAWAIDSVGNPLANVQVVKPAGLGPFRDGFGPNQLDPGALTRPLGLIALFDLPSPKATLSLTPPSPLKADAFELPIRPGALTLSTLILR